ncbi:cold shock and DUF1294 domain-containing protein [Solilutibacter tolerans]|uniref:Uncharacterized membrane protein YsdA, DUF1294 family n=1 Tax=Solilutibacter tolerans TaxID=1604334 RepID=A0A1N6YIJ7_9GAMM|nr:cold shock and DUF1294 domain-containing protein [Lysobacter tolerans]SIR14380.1 Uncharacterized membrane protein YsdA, DUF1294 family [Lysobacter tolerans]
MRQVGRIQDWNDDKGFGFAVPHGGGPKVFVHISAFQFGSNRPKNGDLISYDLSTDDRGRPRATNTRFAGQRIETKSAPTRLPRKALGLIAMAIIGSLAALHKIPWLVAGTYALVSGLSYLAYALDKSSAEHSSRRTPESTLHFLDLIGGWPGALIAQQQFRHKTVKTSFQTTFWLTVIINIALVGWLVSSGTIERFVA